MFRRTAVDSLSSVPAPANVAIYNVTETTVTVNWTMQYITQDELFQVILSNPSLSNSTQSFGVTPLVENCMYSIVVTGLEPSTAYKIQIAASHAAGQSISEHVNFTTNGTVCVRIGVHSALFCHFNPQAWSKTLRSFSCALGPLSRVQNGM